MSLGTNMIQRTIKYYHINIVITNITKSNHKYYFIVLLHLSKYHQAPFSDKFSLILLEFFLYCHFYHMAVSLSTSLIMFHLISFSPHSLIMFHFYFPQSAVHVIHFIYHSPSNSHLPYLAALILQGHSTLLSVSLFFR